MFFCLIVWSAGFPTGVENMGGCSKLDGDNKVHLIIKLLAISLQACKFTKLSFFTHIFQGFYLDFKLLFIVLFSRNHFMEGCFTFKWEGGRG